MSRAGAKDLAHDYLEAVPAAGVAQQAAPAIGIEAPVMAAKAPSPEEIQREGRERWRRERNAAKARGHTQTAQERERESAEHWLKYRAEVKAQEEAAARAAGQETSPLSEAQQSAARWAAYRALPADERAAQERAWQHEREVQQKEQSQGFDGPEFD